MFCKSAKISVMGFLWVSFCPEDFNSTAKNPILFD